MKKYDGWLFKNKWGSLLSWTFAETKKEIKIKVYNWRAWEKEGHKIIKIKFVEVK